jgi:hypothetical protein
MVDEARNRDDRAAIGSDEKRAQKLGASRMSIHRWKCELREAGLIKHDGYHVWDQRLPSGHPKRTVRWIFPTGVLRCRRVTQRSSSRRPNTPKPLVSEGSNVYGGPGLRRCASRGRVRRLMDNHPERIRQGVTRADGSTTPFNAGDAIAAVSDLCSAQGVRVPPTLRARLGKSAKVCLADGFDPEIVVAALFLAARRGRVSLVEEILLDLQWAKSGQHLGPIEYRKALQDASELIQMREGTSLIDTYIQKKEA